MIEAVSTERRRVSRQAFGVGLYAIGAAYWREVTDAMLETFYRVLGDAMTESEWQRVVEHAIGPDSADRTFPPTPGRLLAILHELRNPGQHEREGMTPAERAAREAEADEIARREGLAAGAAR